MIVAVWNRWIHTRQWWWLAVLGGLLVADVLVGGWLIAWEVRTFAEALR